MRMGQEHLGYTDIGLDDNWQECHVDLNNNQNYFHDDMGRPLVNHSSFPNLTAMVEQILALGLTAGWYHNNCICAERDVTRWKNSTEHYLGDVQATFQYGFDSVKIDGCGLFNDRDLWYQLFADMSSQTKTNTTSDGRNRIMIENCAWGYVVPQWRNASTSTNHKNGTATQQLWCPWHIYRTSSDIAEYWDNMFFNLQSTRPFQDMINPLSRPGCWAFPDMLMVGQLYTANEDRAHFGAWVITSAPLILSHDMYDDVVAQRVWPIVANIDAIRINQDWVGHPGHLALETIGRGNKVIQIWTKPLSNNAQAVLVINNNDPYVDGLPDDTGLLSMKTIFPPKHPPDGYTFQSNITCNGTNIRMFYTLMNPTSRFY